MLHSWNQSATGGNPVRESAGKPVARDEEIERRFQTGDLQGDSRFSGRLKTIAVNSGFFSFPEF